MTSRLVYLLCLLLAACALASKPLGRQVCVAACYYSLLKISYSGQDATARKACTNPLRVFSTYLCAHTHCQEDDIVPGIEWWASNCKKSSSVVNLETYRGVTANVTAEYIASLPTVELTSKTTFDGMALPSEHNWGLVFRTTSTYNAAHEHNVAVRWALYGFWGLVILFGSAKHAWSWIASKPRGDRPAAAPKTGGMSSLKSWINANIFMAPTFGYHHHQPLGWFTIPLRFQTMVIFAYIILHIVVSATNYSVFNGNYYYSTRSGQVLRYFGDRIAHLMSAALPFVFLFGARGNILIYATGWSYRTFNIFHRWVAIILTVEGIIHGLSFSAYYVWEKGWEGYREELKTSSVMYSGIMMLTAIGLTVFVAFGPLRARMYEFFRLAHIGLAAIFIAAYYVHVKDQFSGAYRVWAWACIGLWVGDYFMRLMRLVVMNYKVLFGKSVPALASYSEETGMIRLQIHPSVMSRRQTPGEHYFLHVCGWRFWQSHPFTLAGRSAEVNDYLSSSPYSSAYELSDREIDGKPSPQSTRARKGDGNGGYLTFIIRPREGMTKHLRDSLRQGNSWGQRRLRILLEGPYGTPTRLDKFNNVLFLAGGSGITTVLPYLRSFFEDGLGGDEVPPNTKLAWTVRHEGLVHDVLANDLRRVEGAARLSMEFYVTQRTTGEKPRRRDLRFRGDRPNVETLVEDFVSRHGGRTAIFVCGPAQLADTTRQAVIQQVKRGYNDVELFEAMFGW